MGRNDSPRNTPFQRRNIETDGKRKDYQTVHLVVFRMQTTAQPMQRGEYPSLMETEAMYQIGLQ